MSEKGLSILKKKELIIANKDNAIDPYNHYLFDKQHKVSFSTFLVRRSELLRLVHYDICDPLEVESLGGNKYFFTFIDDASRKV